MNVVESWNILSEFRPLTPAEEERIEKHFARLLKQFEKAQNKALRMLRKLNTDSIEALPLQNVQELQVKKSLLYLRPLDPVHFALCVALLQVSPAKVFIEVEIGLCHKDALNNAPSKFITLKALKGESVPADIVIQASICPVCGNLSEDGKLCKTCRADKYYLKEILALLKEDEKQAFLNGTLNLDELDELWGKLKERELKLRSEESSSLRSEAQKEEAQKKEHKKTKKNKEDEEYPNLVVYRLKTLYPKAPKLIPYLKQLVNTK